MGSCHRIATLKHAMSVRETRLRMPEARTHEGCLCFASSANSLIVSLRELTFSLHFAMSGLFVILFLVDVVTMSIFLVIKSKNCLTKSKDQSCYVLLLHIILVSSPCFVLIVGPPDVNSFILSLLARGVCVLFMSPMTRFCPLPYLLLLCSGTSRSSCMEIG